MDLMHANLWLKIFEFICPVELGLVIALARTGFNRLVKVHFQKRKVSLGRLRILRANGRNGAEIVNEPRSDERLPIPPQLLPPSQDLLPANVVGFERILISYVDKNVILFLQRIRRLFDWTTVCVRISDNEQDSWDIVRNNIFPLLQKNVCGLSLFFISDIDNLRRRSPSILRQCPNLRSIHYLGHFPRFPGADNDDASSPEALAKWLLTPREDGIPKTLHCCYNSLGIERLRETFDNAREAVSFIITFHVKAAFVATFESVNTLGEQLTLRRQNAEDNWLLVRKPTGQDEANWAELEEEAIEWAWRARQKRIMIKFADNDIGDMGGGTFDANDVPIVGPIRAGRADDFPISPLRAHSDADHEIIVSCKCAGGIVVRVRFSLLVQSTLFQNLCKVYNIQDNWEFLVTEISSHAFKLVVEWMQLRIGKPELVLQMYTIRHATLLQMDPETNEYVPFPQQNNFIDKLTEDDLAKLLHASDYLGMESLFFYAARSLAVRIRGKNVEQIQAVLRIDEVLNEDKKKEILGENEMYRYSSIF